MKKKKNHIDTLKVRITHDAPGWLHVRWISLGFSGHRKEEKAKLKGIVHPEIPLIYCSPRPG